MQWCDDGVVIGLRHHGETAVIVELLTRERGRHLGFVHGGRSRRLRPTLQPGNTVRATWQARTDDLMGSLTIEPLTLRAAHVMAAALSLHGVNLICALARQLPEREAHPGLYLMAEAILDRIEDQASTPAAIVGFELILLRELGFGLDLDRCALTGSTEHLAYVSPRTGRAVARDAGAPFHDRILALPAFLLADGMSAPPPSDIVAGFALTEHFLLRHIFGPRGLPMPDCRRAYLAALLGPTGSRTLA